jgi:hypothetical protein
VEKKWFVFIGVQEATPLRLKRLDGGKRILDHTYTVKDGMQDMHALENRGSIR